VALREQHVLRLDVAVDDAEVVRVRKGVSDLAHDAQRVRNR
jgi:hypothetical protein